MKRTISEINALTAGEFTALLGGAYEHSPWIAEKAAKRRPFRSLEEVRDAMAEVVREASLEAQLELIRAHPDLAGKLARLGQLTPESTREQAAAGLDAMNASELQFMRAANQTYREKFGFPFIICARQHTKKSILAAIAGRLEHDAVQEMAAALQEIHRIAQLRLDDLICPEN